MIPPRSGGAPTHLVVLLHGYGSDGNDLIGLAPHFAQDLPDALYVSPNGPAACANLASGYQWFDIDFDGDRLASRQMGVVSARPILEKFLSDLWAQTGLGPDKTILVGFSQGAMMALHTGLAISPNLFGIIAFSGAFVPAGGFGPDGPKPPVCLVHGDSDTVVDPRFSAEAEAALAAAGVPVRHHVSRGTGHGIAPDGLAFARAFLARIALA